MQDRFVSRRIRTQTALLLTLGTSLLFAFVILCLVSTQPRLTSKEHHSALLSMASATAKSMLRAGEDCYKCTVKVKCKKQCDFVATLCNSPPKEAPGPQECKAFNTKCRGEICATEKWKSTNFADEYQIWVKKLLCFTGARDNYAICAKGAGSDLGSLSYCKGNLMRSVNEC